MLYVTICLVILAIIDFVIYINGDTASVSAAVLSLLFALSLPACGIIGVRDNNISCIQVLQADLAQSYSYRFHDAASCGQLHYVLISISLCANINHFPVRFAHSPAPIAFPVLLLLHVPLLVRDDDQPH